MCSVNNVYYVCYVYDVYDVYNVKGLVDNLCMFNMCTMYVLYTSSGDSE